MAPVGDSVVTLLSRCCHAVVTLFRVDIVASQKAAISLQRSGGILYSCLRENSGPGVPCCACAMCRLAPGTVPAQSYLHRALEGFQSVLVQMAVRFLYCQSEYLQ